MNAELRPRLIALNSGGNSMSGIEPASDELTWVRARVGVRVRLRVRVRVGGQG